MNWPTKFAVNSISALPANVQKLLNKSEARKQQEFRVKRVRNSIKLGRPIMSLPTEFKVNPNQQFVCINCTETVETQRNVCKGLTGQERPIRSLPTKFKLNWISGLCANMRKLLNQSKAKNGRNSVKHGQKLARLGKAHNELVYQI